MSAKRKPHSCVYWAKELFLKNLPGPWSFQHAIFDQGDNNQDHDYTRMQKCLPGKANTKVGHLDCIRGSDLSAERLKKVLKSGGTLCCDTLQRSYVASVITTNVSILLHSLTQIWEVEV